MYMSIFVFEELCLSYWGCRTKGEYIQNLQYISKPTKSSNCSAFPRRQHCVAFGYLYFEHFSKDIPTDESMVSAKTNELVGSLFLLLNVTKGLLRISDKNRTQNVCIYTF